MTILINNVRNVAARIGAVRAMSTSPPPRMHKAKDAWHRIKETRPPEGHPHNVFHPPYNSFASGVAILTIIGLGAGVIEFGRRHQQKKQGYWK